MIVGGGTAGFNAIRTMRQLGCTDDIALVSAETPYSRMVLPYYLEQQISESRAYTASMNQLEAWGVKMHFGRRAAKLDTGSNTLTLDNDEALTYDNLLIATGSSAQKLPIPGADGARVYNFWTMADAKGLHQHLSSDAHVVMVGGGFIAFTILSGVLSRAAKVTIVEVAPRVLPRMVDDAGAAIITAKLEQAGVALKTGTSLSKIEDAGEKKRLTLADGSTLDADVVVMATGITANLGWLEGSGVTVNGGVEVDDQMRSNVANVYAAGDVAAGKNRISGKREVHAIEPTAMEHGRVAGANMAGQSASYGGSLLMNIVGVAGLDFASFGDWDAADAEAVTLNQPNRPAYRKYLFRGDVMVGAIFVGPSGDTWSSNDLGMIKGLVQSGRPLGPWKAHLAKNPLDVKKAYLASQTVSALMGETTLGQPSADPRG